MVDHQHIFSYRFTRAGVPIYEYYSHTSARSPVKDETIHLWLGIFSIKEVVMVSGKETTIWIAIIKPLDSEEKEIFQRLQHYFLWRRAKVACSTWRQWGSKEKVNNDELTRCNTLLQLMELKDIINSSGGQETIPTGFFSVVDSPEQVSLDFINRIEKLKSNALNTLNAFRKKIGRGRVSNILENEQFNYAS